MGNTLMVIYPYKYQGMWVFDDEAVGLIREPFVSGADDIIEKMVTHIPDAEKGFNLIFSAVPFPGYQAEFERREEEFGGYWYYFRQLDMQGWLCPALFEYFEEAPLKPYAQFKARSA